MPFSAAYLSIAALFDSINVSLFSLNLESNSVDDLTASINPSFDSKYSLIDALLSSSILALELR